MAVSVGDLAIALRIITSGEPAEPVRSILTRLLGVADATVEKAAPDAPDSIKDQATIQMASYLFDMPTAARGTGHAAAFRNSGAQHLLFRWISRTTGITPEAVTE